MTSRQARLALVLGCTAAAMLLSFLLVLALATVLPAFHATSHTNPRYVLRAPQLDTGLKEAMRLGQESVPELVKHMVEHGTEPVKASVKTAFTDGVHTEYLWVQVSGVLTDGFLGTLAAQPAYLRSVHRGQPLIVPLNEVVDWSLSVAGEPSRGNFTTCHLAALPGQGDLQALVSQEPSFCAWADAYGKLHGKRTSTGGVGSAPALSNV